MNLVDLLIIFCSFKALLCNMDDLPFFFNLNILLQFEYVFFRLSILLAQRIFFIRQGFPEMIAMTSEMLMLAEFT